MADTNVGIIVRAIDRATGPVRRIGRAFQTMGKDTRAALKGAGQIAQRFGATVSLVAGAIAIGSARQTAEVESALGELASVGVKNLAAIRAEAQAFSNQWAGTNAPDFIRAAYDIKSGISVLSDEAVAQFTSLAAMTAKATKSSVEDMTSLFASAYGIYKEQFPDKTPADFMALFSGGLSASVQQFKTTGVEMQQAIQTLGAEATKAKIPLSEQLSIMGMLQQTMTGSEAGTKYLSFLQGAVKAGKALGLPFLDANKQIKSMPEILRLMRVKFGDELDAAESEKIKLAFGRKEAVALIKLLYDQTGALKDNISGLNSTMKDGAKVTREMAEVQNDGLGEGFQKATQKAKNLADIIGKSLKPALMPLLDTVGKVLLQFQVWAKEYPNLTRAILVGSTVLGGLIAVLGTATIAISSLNLALLANPITWIVLAIVAAVTVLVGAGYVLFKNWDRVLSWFAEAWTGFKNSFASAWESTKETTSTAFSHIMDALDPAKMWERGKAMVLALWDGYKAIWSGLKSWLWEKVQDLTSWMPDTIRKSLGLDIAAGATAPAAAPGALPPVAHPSTGGASGDLQKIGGEVRVRFENAPQGLRVTKVQKDGPLDLGVDTGFAFGGA
jgi:TP901 family phage tail tape measure protein